MRWRLISKVSWAAALLAVACACRNQPKGAPVIGDAYVGPATLKIRSDIPLQSSSVATVKHGERLEIIQRRRRFLRVRTPGGVEGWTDESLLLGAADMADLKDLAARAAKMPSQGLATTFGDLNVHTLPTRGSPSFLQLHEGEKFDVLGHVTVPVADAPRKPLIPPPPKKKAAAVPKKPKKEPKIPPPPMPLPPGPPPNWLDLSKTEMDADDDPPPPAPPKPVPTQDWSLVRTTTGVSGWALTRRLMMAIPDEVAQYAEGRRIVSYFPLGNVQDGDQKKPVWLWTTIRAPGPYDFDSWRVFIWSLRHHRYETSYIERTVRGYSPVLLHDVDFASGKTAAAKYPGFSVCVEKADGQKYRREYALLGSVVRYAGERPCELPPPVYATKGTAPVAAVPVPEAPKASLGQRMKDRVKGWFKKETKGTPQ